MAPNPEHIHNRETGRRGTKITLAIFLHVGVFLWILIVWVFKNVSNFKMTPFSLDAASRLFYWRDLWTNTLLQMHRQGKQALHFFHLLFLGTRIHSNINLLRWWGSCRDWVLLLTQPVPAWKRVHVHLPTADRPTVLPWGAHPGAFGITGISVTTKGEKLPNRILFSENGNTNTDGQEKPALVMCFWFFLEKALKRPVPSNPPGEQGEI